MLYKMKAADYCFQP